MEEVLDSHEEARCRDGTESATGVEQIFRGSTECHGAAVSHSGPSLSRRIRSPEEREEGPVGGI